MPNLRLGLRALCLAMLALSSLAALPSCGEVCDSAIDPVKCSDLCEQDPPHADCMQCRVFPRDRRCPQCVADPMAEGCPDATSGGTGAGSGSGGSSGSAGGGQDGGSGEGGESGAAGTVSGQSAGGEGGVVGGMVGGMTSGEGGTMMPPVSCDGPDDCPAARAVCGSEGRCVVCGGDPDCAAHHAPRVRCDVSGAVGEPGVCVQCTSNAQCGTATPECVDGLCKECRTHDDCDDPQRPQCGGDGECVPCDGAAACADRGVRSICDMRAAAISQTSGQCVQCLTHSSCENPVPQCDGSGTCVACTSSNACSGRSDGDIPIEQCNTHLNRATTGQCVQCIGDSGTAPSSTVCGAFSCNRSSGRCTATDVGTRRPCETCVADSECEEDAMCMPHALGSSSLGSFCFPVRDGACAGVGNPSLKPFNEPSTSQSVDGATVAFCAPSTSCAAYLDAVLGSGGGRACGAELPACGVGDPTIDGALCISNVSAELDGRCSYLCDSSYDCPGGSTGFTACPAATGQRFCRPP